MTMAKQKQARELDANGYRLAPIILDDRYWLYEDANGIEVHAHDVPATLSAELPWSLLCTLVDNHRKLKSKL